MNLKLLMAVTLIAIAPTVVFAQKDDPADPAPKPTLADVQKVVQTISSDKTKLQAYCELGNLQDQMQKAEDRNDTKAVDELVAGADPRVSSYQSGCVASQSGLRLSQCVRASPGADFRAPVTEARNRRASPTPPTCPVVRGGFTPLVDLLHARTRARSHA
jgi:hypothetical protein